ncbi:MAG: FHA domain-containing protein [Nannocystaceae bacterium]
MDHVKLYSADAFKLPEREFVAQHGNLFLVKEPSLADAEWEANIHYETVYVAAPTTSMPEDGLEDGAAFEASWRVAPVRKREGNPFPDRISIGRARNCDIVLRLSYISKLHAHFLISGSGLRLCDQRSANGTAINGTALRPGRATPVSLGNNLAFGNLNVQLLNGAGLIKLLREL